MRQNCASTDRASEQRPILRLGLGDRGKANSLLRTLSIAFDRHTDAQVRLCAHPARVLPVNATENKGLVGLEKSLEELEALVARREGGDLPLEQALKEF